MFDRTAWTRCKQLKCQIPIHDMESVQEVTLLILWEYYFNEYVINFQILCTIYIYFVIHSVSLSLPISKSVVFLCPWIECLQMNIIDYWLKICVLYFKKELVICITMNTFFWVYFHWMDVCDCEMCNVCHSVHVDKDLHDQKSIYLNTSPSLMTLNVCKNVNKNHSRLHKASFF